MTFSVTTSWLLPMNDRLHVRTGLDLSGSEEECQAEVDRLGAYLGALPEYSMVEVMSRYGPGLRMVRVVGAVVYGAEGGSAGSGSLPVDNLLVLDVDDASLVSEDSVDGVGYCIPARDVRHAVVRIVPDMTEIRTQDDRAHYDEEFGRAAEEAMLLCGTLAGTMPDGSLMDLVIPSPDQDTGALVDKRGTGIIYKGRLYPLSADFGSGSSEPEGPIQYQ